MVNTARFSNPSPGKAQLKQAHRDMMPGQLRPLRYPNNHARTVIFLWQVPQKSKCPVNSIAWRCEGQGVFRANRARWLLRCYEKFAIEMSARSLLIILGIIVLSGCASSPSKIEFRNNRIGLILQEQQNTLCHDFTGFTIFNNFIKPYELPFKLDKLVESSVREVLQEKGFFLIRLPRESKATTTDLIKRSSWDNSAKILDESRTFFSALLATYNLDAVFIMTNEPITGRNENCTGVLTYATGGQYGPFIYPPIIHIFTESGAAYGNLYTNSYKSMPDPENNKELSISHLETVGAVIKKTIQHRLSEFPDRLLK